MVKSFWDAHLLEFTSSPARLEYKSSFKKCTSYKVEVLYIFKFILGFKIMAGNLTEDSIVEHKFVVSLDEIKLDIYKPVECIIKYEYNLFCSYEICTQPFSLHQENSNFQAIPQDCRPQRNFFISTPKIEEHLKSHPLKIQVYDKDILLGNSTIELCKVYSSEADKMWFGLRHMGEASIIGSNDNEIGRIKFLLVLETQDCIECKYCNEYFKESTIRKHAIHNKKCNIYYTEEDLKFLEELANKRRRQRRSQKHKNTYDPDKRSKIHKDTYDPKKQKHDPIKRRKKYIKEKLYKKEEKETARKETLFKYKNSSANLAKERNQEYFDQTKSKFKDYCERVEKALTFSVEAKEKIQEINVEIEVLFKALGKEIDTIVEKVKDVSCIEEAAKHFTKLSVTKKKDKDEAEQDFKNDKEPQKHRLYYQWLELQLKNTAVLREIAKDCKQLDGWLGLSKEEIKEKKLGG